MAKILLREGPDPLQSNYQIFSKVPYQDYSYDLFKLAPLGI